MRFLLDAMPPRRLARRLTALGRDAVHALDLPLGKLTRDGLVIHESWRSGERGVTLTATAPQPG